MSKDETKNSNKTIPTEPDQSVLNVHPMESKEGSNTAQNPPNESRQAPKLRWVRRFVWKEVIAIIALVIYFTQTYYMKKQWEVMDAQLKEIKKSSEDTQKLLNAATAQATNTGILAEATKAASETAKVQATAAKESADAAKRAIEVTRENIRLDQRAWVGVKAMRFKGQIEVGQKLEFEVIVQNTGKTPAFQTTIKKSFSSAKPTTQLLNRPISGVLGVLVMPPGVDFESPQTISEKLTETEVKLLQSGSPLHIYGVIQYRDIFRNNRTTYFCGFYDGKGFPSFNFCPTLNTME